MNRLLIQEERDLRERLSLADQGLAAQTRGAKVSESLADLRSRAVEPAPDKKPTLGDFKNLDQISQREKELRDQLQQLQLIKTSMKMQS